MNFKGSGDVILAAIERRPSHRLTLPSETLGLQ